MNQIRVVHFLIFFVLLVRLVVHRRVLGVVVVVAMHRIIETSCLGLSHDSLPGLAVLISFFVNKLTVVHLLLSFTWAMGSST